MAMGTADDRRGHAEVAIVALGTFGALGCAKEGTIEARIPTLSLSTMVGYIFHHSRKLYPQNERIVRASLTCEFVDGNVQYDSDVFGEYYVVHPDIREYDPSMSLEDLRGYLHTLLRKQAYLCITQVIATAEDLPLDSPEFPTRDDFDDLSEWLAQTGYGPCDAIDFMLGADFMFGTNDDGTVPFDTYYEPLNAYVVTLEANVDSGNPTRTRRWLRSLVVSELRFLVNALRAALEAHAKLDSGKPLDTDAKRLTRFMVEPRLPVTRTLSAEYLCYVLNREADRAPTPDLAEDLRRTAVTTAEIALTESWSPRHAKYIAQNLLDIAEGRDDQFIREQAEAIWMDTYIAPFQARLQQLPSAMTELGWTGPVYAADVPFAFADVPAYSTDPTFIYDGAASEVLQQAEAGFSTDHLAAALLLVQRFKDLRMPAGLEDPDLSLLLFDPDGEDLARFPLLIQHPIAWIHHFAGALFAEQAHGNLNAGLGTPSRLDWDQRHRVERILIDIDAHLDEHTQSTTTPGLPTIAAQLLPPTIEHMSSHGHHTLAKAWADIVFFWSVD